MQNTHYVKCQITSEQSSNKRCALKTIDFISKKYHTHLFGKCFQIFRYLLFFFWFGCKTMIQVNVSVKSFLSENVNKNTTQKTKQPRKPNNKTKLLNCKFPI